MTSTQATSAAKQLIFKIEDATIWAHAMATGGYNGAPVDLADGFIHFSTADQVAGTLAKHFAQSKKLVLAAIDPSKLTAELKWEEARGGVLFPHLYGRLNTEAVVDARDIPDPHDLSKFADWGINPEVTA